MVHIDVCARFAQAYFAQAPLPKEPGALADEAIPFEHLMTMAGRDVLLYVLVLP